MVNIIVVDKNNIDSIISGSLIKRKYPLLDIIDFNDFEYDNLNKDDEIILCGCGLTDGEGMIKLNSTCNLRWFDNHPIRINHYFNYYNKLNDRIDDGDTIKDTIIGWYNINPTLTGDKLLSEIFGHCIIKGELNQNKSISSIIWDKLYKIQKPSINNIYNAISDLVIEDVFDQITKTGEN